jgi:hypothetical protein
MSSPQSLINLNNPINQGGDTASYPGDLGNFSYFTSLHFVKYERPIGGNAQTKPIANIYMPLPLGLEEDFRLRYNSAELGIWGNSFDEMLKAGQNVASGLRDRAGKMSAGDLDAFADSKGQGEFYGSFGKELGLLAGSITGLTARDSGIGAALAQRLGAIPNPHMTTVFNGVQLREHNLNWLLSPRNESDARALSDIINRFRTYAHPEYTQNLGSFALDFPYQVFCNFVGTNSIYPIHRSVIRGIVVDYAGSGQPAFYTGGAPTTVRLQLNLCEVEILTRGDFTNNTKNSYTADGNYAEPTVQQTTNGTTQGFDDARTGESFSSGSAPQQDAGTTVNSGSTA